MTFYPVINGEPEADKGLKIKNIYYPTEYDKNNKEDYDILVLD
jgi:hypothetical protein